MARAFVMNAASGILYSPEALLSEQGDAVEAALWAAVNSLQERAATFRRFEANARPEYAERAEVTERHAATLMDLLPSLIDDYDIG
jgi:hypothetical protein